MKKIVIKLDIANVELRGAIASGWNERFPGDELGPNDIKLQHKGRLEGPLKEDIAAAFPYLDQDNMEITIF